jgi:hypothetical protein
VQAPTTTSARSHTSTSPGTPALSSAESSPGSSIEGYGAEVGGAGKAAVIVAAHSFFTAMARGDHADLCASLAASNRKQLQSFGEGRGGSGSCIAALKALLDPAAATEARKAADATVTSVRIKGDTAFVLFRPKGVPSYFVMKEEGGVWKAISLAPGTPVNPTATP